MKARILFAVALIWPCDLLTTIWAVKLSVAQFVALQQTQPNSRDFGQHHALHSSPKLKMRNQIKRRLLNQDETLVNCDALNRELVPDLLCGEPNTLRDTALLRWR